MSLGVSLHTGSNWRLEALATNWWERNGIHRMPGALKLQQHGTPGCAVSRKLGTGKDYRPARCYIHRLLQQRHNGIGTVLAALGYVT